MFTIIDKLKAWTHKGIGNWRYMTIVFKTHMVFDANTWVCLITGTAILNGASLVHRWKILASRPVSAREKLQRLEIFSKIALIWSRMLKKLNPLTFRELGHPRVPWILSPSSTCWELNCHAPVNISRTTLTPSL